MSQFLTNKKDVAHWLRKMRVFNYFIHEDLTVDVNGIGVNLSNKKLKFIPVQFGVVQGTFNCMNNQLSSLRGSPKVIESDFLCMENQLTTLEYGPKEVKGQYVADSNQLTSLKGIPEKIDKSLFVKDNPIKDFTYLPKEIKEIFNFDACDEINFSKLSQIKHFHCLSIALPKTATPPTYLLEYATLYGDVSSRNNTFTIYHLPFDKYQMYLEKTQLDAIISAREVSKKIKV